MNATSDPTKGRPVYQVRLSQGGPPCISGEHNALPNKITHPFMSQFYTVGCPDVQIGNATYSTQQTYTKIEGLTIDEYTLMVENQKRNGIF